jgi:hypothetical protein
MSKAALALIVGLVAFWLGSAACAQAVSPDGRFTVWINQTGDGRTDANGSQVVVLEDKRTGAERQLLVSHYDADRRRNLTTLTNALFSLDGGYVYVSATDTSPNSGAVHQINLATGAVRFVVGGRAVAVIRTGKYRGYLLVQQHRYREGPQFGSFNPVYVIRPDGRVEFLVPGSDNDYGELAIQPWLAEHGWHAW